MPFQLLSTIRVKLVDAEMQNAYLCVTLLVKHKKNTIYPGYSELHVLIQVKTRGNLLFCRKELVWETDKINKPLMLPAAKIASH